MKQNVKSMKLWALAAWLGLACASAYAQDPQGETPKAPAKVYGPLGVDEQQDQNQQPDAYQPDTRPITGFQQPTVGSPLERHSYWVPGASYYNYIQSNGDLLGGKSEWNSTSYLSGNLSLVENWSRSQLLVNYTGGGAFSTDDTVGNSMVQQVGITQTFNWSRLQLVFLDQFAYLPQSQFGFAAGTGLSTPGVGGSLGGGLTGIGSGLTPGQSIFAAVGPRYFNTGAVQATYQLSARSSVTVGGLYSLLRFRDPGNIESDQYVGNLGYNYQITRSNTIGLQYRFSSFHYPNDPQAIGDHTFLAVFGRKITGRLALTLSAGPEVTNYRLAEPPATKTQYVTGSGGATLNYLVPKGTITANYFHGVSSGSGVFFGATADQVSGAATRQISRVWSGELHAGYAHNRNAQSVPGANTNYDAFFGGVSAARPLGRNATFSLGYTAYVQRTDSSGCGSNCSSETFTTSQITVGVSWHARPFVLR